MLKYLACLPEVYSGGPGFVFRGCLSVLERGVDMGVLCLKAIVPQVAETALNSISEPTQASARQQS